jgi:hypothetical protein
MLLIGGIDPKSIAGEDGLKTAHHMVKYRSSVRLWIISQLLAASMQRSESCPAFLAGKPALQAGCLRPQLAGWQVLPKWSRSRGAQHGRPTNPEFSSNARATGRVLRAAV